MLISAAVEGSVRLVRMDRDGNLDNITQAGSVIGTGSVTADTALVSYVTSMITPNIASVDLGNGEITQLTDVNADILRDVTLGEHEEIWYDSSDDTRVHGWVITPPDFDPAQKYPLLLKLVSHSRKR